MTDFILFWISIILFFIGNELSKIRIALEERNDMESNNKARPRISSIILHPNPRGRLPQKTKFRRTKTLTDRSHGKTKPRRHRDARGGLRRLYDSERRLSVTLLKPISLTRKRIINGERNVLSWRAGGQNDS